MRRRNLIEQIRTFVSIIQELGHKVVVVEDYNEFWSTAERMRGGENEVHTCTFTEGVTDVDRVDGYVLVVDMKPGQTYRFPLDPKAPHTLGKIIDKVMQEVACGCESHRKTMTEMLTSKKIEIWTGDVEEERKEDPEESMRLFLEALDN